MAWQVLLRFSADIPVARIKTITTNVRKITFETSSEAPVRGEAPKNFQVRAPPSASAPLLSRQWTPLPSCSCRGGGALVR